MNSIYTKIFLAATNALFHFIKSTTNQPIFTSINAVQKALFLKHNTQNTTLGALYHFREGWDGEGGLFTIMIVILIH